MADTTITNLPNAAALTGTERVPMDQGATTVDATTQAIANLAPPTNLTYDAATRLLSSSTGTDVTIPLVSTTAAGLIPHTWLTGEEAATLEHIHGNIAGEVYEHVKAGASLSALTPYRIIGGVGDTVRVEVVAADAANSNTMPASGILPGALANNADGHGTVAGVITGVNTAAYPPGTVLYVAMGGGLTATRPSANVQMVAVVGRQHASTGTVVPLIGPSLARVAYTGSYGDLIGLPTLGTAAAAATTDFAPAAQGVTNGNSHNHDGGDGAQIAYSSLLGLPTLGGAAALSVGTAAGTVAAGDDNRFIELSSTAPSNLAATAAAGSGTQAARSDHVHQFQPADVIIPLSGETQSLATGIAVTISRWPRNHVLTAIPLWMVNTASVGAALQFDIRVGGTSIFATLPTIDATEQGSDTAAASAVFSTAFVSAGQLIAQNSVVTFHVLQIGTTTPGAGLKIALPVRRAG